MASEEYRDRSVAARVGLLGRLVVESGGRRVDDSGLGQQGRIALAYLVIHRQRPVGRDELADVLWGECLPRSWETAMRGIVAKVRTAFAAAGLPRSSVLTTAYRCYQLHLPDDAVVDVEEAERALCLAAEALGSGRAGAARTLAQSAVTMCRQPFLAGASGLWVEQRQADLDDLRLRALEALADAALTAGDPAGAAAAGQEAIELAPLRESAHHGVIEALTAAGNRAEALRAYERCRRILAEELGVDPSPETQALYGRLLGTPSVSLPESRPTSRAVPPQLTGWATPFVGRADELALLRAAWDRARRGAFEIAVVAGEPGIGKTRLLGELAAMAAAGGAVVLYGRCDEDASVPYQAVAEAVVGYATGADPGELANLLRGCEPLARLSPVLSAVPADAARSTDPDLDRQQLFEAIRVFLVRLAAMAPVMLLIDDLQWADAPTLGILRHVTRGSEPLPALVAASWRLGDPGVARPLTAVLAELRRARPAQRIDLDGMTERELSAIIEGWAGHPPAPVLATALLEATEGNPFFVEEVLRMLAERRQVGLPGGVVALPAVAQLEVPEGVREVILSRYLRMSDASRRVLAAAAVCGREFNLSVLERLADLADVDVLDGVEEAVTARLVSERADAFAFSHGLVREAIYRQLTAARRRRLHAQIGHGLETAMADGSAVVPLAALASQFLAAGPAERERAVHYAIQAGDEAAQVFAYEDAARHYDDAQRAIGGDDDVRSGSLLVASAGARWRAGDTETARREFERAATVAGRFGDRALMASAALGAAGTGPTAGVTDERLVELLRLALADPPDDSVLRVRLQARLALELVAADSSSADGLCAAAVAAAAELGDRSLVAYTLNAQRWTRLGTEAPADGLAAADRMLALAESAGDRHMILEARMWRFTHLLGHGRSRDAAVEVEAFAQLARAIRQPFYLRYPPRFRACLALGEGRLADAERLAAEAYTIERRVHPINATVHSLVHQIVLRQAQGRLAELAGAVTEAMTGQPDAVHWRVAHALLAGSRPSLRDLAADDGAARLGQGPLWGFNLAMAAEACLLVGDRAVSQAVYDALVLFADRDLVGGCGVVWLGPAARYLDRLAGSLGRGRVRPAGR